MGHGSPLRFVPGHRPPEDPGADPWCFAVRRRELLVTLDHRLPSVVELDASGLEAIRRQYLGRLEGRHCYSVELAAEVAPPPGMAFRDLRALFGHLDETVHALAGRAVQIVEWDRTHQFCGVCAAATELSLSDRSRSCPSCRIPMYPRLSPAMIVAVEREGEILLARARHFPAGLYSVLAGFVEPGESAEEAVVREVFEETGIVVDGIRYFGSQAWPFPNSLMLGFTAHYASGEIEIDPGEIEHAAWFHVDALPPTFSGLSVSISQRLIADFVRRRRG
jgi:NAD+ diphosphatase